jgi:toxin YoeB
MRLVFSDDAWSDYLHWKEHDRATLARLNELIKDTRRSPFKGIGKPEPLVGDLRGWWSRRITREHRLVYRVCGRGSEATLEIAAYRFHYR